MAWAPWVKVMSTFKKGGVVTNEKQTTPDVLLERIHGAPDLTTLSLDMATAALESVLAQIETLKLENARVRRRNNELDRDRAQLLDEKRKLEDEVGQQRRTLSAVLARAREAEKRLEAYRDGSAVFEANKRILELEAKLATLELERHNFPPVTSAGRVLELERELAAFSKRFESCVAERNDLLDRVDAYRTRINNALGTLGGKEPK